MRQSILFLFGLLLTCSLSAQEFHGGFRAGLNFVSFDGPREMGMGGQNYETFNTTTGFHVGATFALAFTDLIGVKADLMYSQKGGEILFEGPSYFYLYANRDDQQGDIIFGDVNSEYGIVNSYIDIPLVAYYRLGSLEIEGGVTAGFLVSSRVTGGSTYNTPTFGVENDIIFSIDGNYLSDPSGGAGVISADGTMLSTGATAPGVISAFYNSNKDDALYRRLDFGLVAGVSYFLNSGLYLGVRYQYGLTDVTKGENDLRLTDEDGLEGREFNTDDEDFSRSIQASVGFRF